MIGHGNDRHDNGDPCVTAVTSCQGGIYFFFPAFFTFRRKRRIFPLNPQTPSKSLGCVMKRKRVKSCYRLGAMLYPASCLPPASFVRGAVSDAAMKNWPLIFTNCSNLRLLCFHGPDTVLSPAMSPLWICHA